MKQSYEAEARERWGNTQAYVEHTEKTKGYTPDKWKEANDGLMNIFAEFAALKNGGFEANSEEVQALVVKLQKHNLIITIPAPMKYYPVSVRCMLVMKDLRRI